MDRRKILVVGGGFGGIKSCLMLAKNPNFEVTLITDNPNFRYYPTLYRTATGGVDQLSSIPLEQIFRKLPISIRIGSVSTVDRTSHIVKTADQSFSYDILILALGVKTNYFHIDGLEKYSYGIKTIEDANRLKKHLHNQITDNLEPDLNYVVIGGGPTGVELAAILPSYITKILKNHQLSERPIHVDLIEATDRMLPRSPKDLSKKVEKHLVKLGINLYTDTVVESETSGRLLANNKPILSHSVIWTAGVSNHPFFLDNKFNLSKHGRVIVDQYLQTEPDIYVIGDNADTRYSGLAQTAIYDAEFVSTNLTRQVKNLKPLRYKPKQPIYVFSAGPNWSAVLWGKTKIYGLLGSWLRQMADIVGFHSFEPWQLALKQATMEMESEDDCPICDKKN
jgi:NADH dehydrogenase